MLFDTHMHCDYSLDSHMHFSEAIAAADKLNIGTCITEHWDYDYPANDLVFMFNLGCYWERAERLRTENHLFGLEIGMQPHIAASDEATAASYPFDYVLGAIHCLEKQDIYYPAYYETRDRLQAVRRLLEESIACVRNHPFVDSFAHIDYICRYWPYEGAAKELYLSDAPELFDELFKELAIQEKPLEINTRRLDTASAREALLPIYKRFKELGGKFCTIGSDAHYTEHVGRGLKSALSIAEQAKLQPVYFKQRKLQYLGEK